MVLAHSYTTRSECELQSENYNALYFFKIEFWAMGLLL